jgi:phosphate:Na+ symporter
MLSMARENVHTSFMQMINFKEELKAEVDEKEDYIDYLNKEISKYISRVITHERTEKGSQIFNSYLTITGNVERIGDHAVNVCGYSRQLKEKNIKLSDMAQKEVEEIRKTLDKLLKVLLETESIADIDVIEWHGKIAAMEQKIDDMTKEYRNNMFERIRNGSCKDEGSILFSEMLTDFERIGDHALNISDELVKIAMVER